MHLAIYVLQLRFEILSFRILSLDFSQISENFGGNSHSDFSKLRFPPKINILSVHKVDKLRKFSQIFPKKNYFGVHTANFKTIETFYLRNWGFKKF